VLARLLILGEVGLYREALAGSLGRDERFEVVAVVPNVESALEVLDCVGADVVLVDTRMLDGTDAVRELAAAAPQVKLVALAVREVEPR
jgi:DNA-binding NarL/FixJ family response regulator